MTAPTLRFLLDEARAALEAAGVDSPALSARLLAGHVLSLTNEAMARDPEVVVAAHDAEAFRVLVRRRAEGDPVAYILGAREFYGLDFRVTPAVLVPRPETEHLVDEARALFPADAALLLADLGTGSGCLAVTLCTVFPAARAVAVDSSAQALAVARHNAEAHGVGHRIEFVEGDFARPCAPAGTQDLVVANPPYVSAEEYVGLSPEVRDFEPRSALVPEPGGMGLEALAALAPAAWAMLRPGGVLLCEFGCEQGPAVADLLGRAGFADVTVGRDLAGLDRWARARRP